MYTFTMDREMESAVLYSRTKGVATLASKMAALIDTGELKREDLLIDHGSASLLPIFNASAIEISYDLPIGTIKDITACYGRLDEVLILAHTGVYSLDLEEPSTLHSLAITGVGGEFVPYYYRSSIISHEDYVYLSRYNTSITKFLRTGDTLAYISTFRNGVSAMALDTHGHLYCISSGSTHNHGNLYVLDADTMDIICTLNRPFPKLHDLIVTPDNRVHVATETGVFVCDTNADPVGMSYLEGMECYHITISQSGTIAVGITDRVAIVSSDCKSICFVLQNWPIGRCAIVNDDFLFYNSSNVVLPQTITKPPYSLFSLCTSAILSELEEQPVSLLPPKLSMLFAPWGRRMWVELVKNGAVCGRYPLQLKPSLTRQCVSAIVRRKRWLECKDCCDCIHKVCGDDTSVTCLSCDSRVFLMP